MHAMHAFIEGHLPVSILVLVAAFIVLAKCADLFVTSAAELAISLKVPKLVVGIVLISLATTAPELSVSLLSVLRGSPEMALGNAIGSVICDDGLALALCGIVSVSAISVIPVVLRTSGVFLLFVEIIAFLFVAWDFTLSRLEGLFLLVCFAGYILLLVRQHRQGHFHADVKLEAANAAENTLTKKRLTLMFVASLLGIIFASDFIVSAAKGIALASGVPEGIIALTIVAFGTSIPEVATCVAAARKGEGALAVGNVIGADIMNICWVAGASAVANDLVLRRQGVYFMFPAMFVIVGLMLILLRINYNLTRWKGFVLLAAYIAYLASFFIVYRPH